MVGILSHTPALPPSGRPLRRAGTLLLIRDGDAGVEVLMQQRSENLRFLPGYWAFPGGTESPSDADTARTFGELGASSVSLAETLAVTALRETAEELGVLCGVTHPGLLSESEWDGLCEGTMAFASLLQSRRETLCFSGIRNVGRWVGPHGEPAQFDTWFFALPYDESLPAKWKSVEVATAKWQNAAQFLQQERDGAARMVPPTLAMMEALASCPDVPSVMQHMYACDPTLPQLTWLSSQ
ncbi:MAG: NUDIX domain-containing protein [Alicyclobacillaceae bacterium]|nr:NUDIX domain-containing protein [Alicyclobacillaceae bacterium]